jgi:hypothetical protein
VRRCALLLFVGIASVPGAAWAQGMPLGPEFRVNTYTTNSQDNVAIARARTGGGLVVVWSSYGQDGSSSGVFGQRYDFFSGSPLGPEFRVNAYTTNTQRRPAVAIDANSNFVVVWESGGQDGSSYGVFGQRFASTGAPLGPEFRVNTYTTLQQGYPAVAIGGNGDFVVVWNSNGPDGQDYGVFGQRYAASGAPLGTEFQINTYTTGYQAHPAVGQFAGGPPTDFMVVWTSYGQDGSSAGVFGQRFAASGIPAGPEFRVNNFTTGHQGGASIDAGFSSFVVVWSSYGQDGSDRGVFAQRYVNGFPQGGEFRVNTHTTGYQGGASVASDGLGHFVVVWASDGPDGSSSGVFSQRYFSGGSPDGPEFRINTYTTGAQELPAVAADLGTLGPGGNFVVVWRSYGQDGSAHGVFGQRFNFIILPVELMDFEVE